MTGRMLTFATLLMAAAPAFAQEPAPSIPEAQTVEAEPAAATIGARWKTEIVKGELHVTLTMLNTGTAPLDVVVARGRSAGPWMVAMIGDEQIDAIRTKAEDRDMDSRMGPMPTFAPLAAGAELTVATYRFKLPKGYSSQPILLEASVETTDNMATLTYEVPQSGV